MAKSYKFYPSEGFEIKELTDDEIKVLNTVITKLGNLNSREIVNKMYSEDAYKETASINIIPFSYSETLSIN